MSQHKVILLTGAPGSGKSTLARMLKEQLPNLIDVVDFGRLLLEQKRRSKGYKPTYEELRARSALIIKPEDISQVDEILIDYVRSLRGKKTVLIDSHAVTRENFGYRITMSSLSVLEQLKLDAIFLLECEPEKLLGRIKQKPEGRILMTVSELQLHQSLQRSVAICYSLLTNCPLFVFENSTSLGRLLSDVLQVLGSLGITPP